MACHLWSLDQTRSPDSWPIVLSVAPPYLSRGDLFETLSRVLWQWQWHVITWVWSMCSPWTWPFGYYVLFSLLSSLPAESVEQQGRVLRCQTSASFFCAFANTLEQKGLFPRSVCLFSSLWPPLLVGPWFWNSLGIDSLCLFLDLLCFHTWDWAGIWPRGFSAGSWKSFKIWIMV